jgi:hypothetical protein
MSWLDIAEPVAALLAIVLFVWVSVKYGIKQALLLLTVALSLILSFVVSDLTGGASTGSHSKWSEAQRRAFRNYGILTGFALVAGTAVFLVVYFLKTLDF